MAKGSSFLASGKAHFSTASLPLFEVTLTVPSVILHEEAAEATEASAKIAEATEKRMLADDVGGRGRRCSKMTA